MQHPQPDGCLPRDCIGALALRSLVACARRCPPSIAANAGAVRIARRAGAPQPPQGCGAWNSDIGRSAVNGPHSAHR